MHGVRIRLWRECFQDRFFEKCGADRHFHLLSDLGEILRCQRDPERPGEMRGELLGVGDRSSDAGAQHRHHRALTDHVVQNRLVMGVLGRGDR